MFHKTIIRNYVCRKAISFSALALLLLTLTMSVALPATTAQAESKKYKRTVERYSIPDVVLINQNGKKVRLASLLNSEQPVVVDFIYGTCTTICPVLSAGYVNLQRKLGPAGQNVRLQHPSYHTSRLPQLA